MLEIKVFLALSAAALALLAYIPYLANLLKGRTMPHAFSWLVWAIISGVVFWAQFTGGAGIASFAVGITTGICVLIFFWALAKGDRKYSALDWVSLAGALLAIVLWIILKDPTASVILAVVIDTMAFIPTFTKAYRKPHEETILTFSLSGVKFFLVLISLEAVTLITALYPAYLVFANFVFVGMVVARRRSSPPKSR